MKGYHEQCTGLLIVKIDNNDNEVTPIAINNSGIEYIVNALLPKRKQSDIVTYIPKNLNIPTKSTLLK